MYVEYRIVDNLGLIYDLWFNCVRMLLCMYICMFVCMFRVSNRKKRLLLAGRVIKLYVGMVAWAVGYGYISNTYYVIIIG